MLTECCKKRFGLYEEAMKEKLSHMRGQTEEFFYGTMRTVSVSPFYNHAACHHERSGARPATKTLKSGQIFQVGAQM